MQSKKTPSKGHDPSAEDVTVIVEPTLKGTTVTGFVGGKTTVENPVTKRYDGREYGLHFSQTWEGVGATEEFVTPKVVEGTINGIRKLEHDFRARLAAEKVEAAAKKAAEEVAAREAAADGTVTPDSHA